MDLTDVYTKQLISNQYATTEAPPVRLSLSDLETGCFHQTSTAGQSDNGINYSRCNPYLQVPIGVKRLGYPYWAHCGNEQGFLFDPPGAVPPLTGLFPESKTSTTKSATAEATPLLDAATKTTSASSQSTIVTPFFVPESSTTTLPLDPTSPDNGPAVLIPSPTSAEIVATVGTQTLGAVAGSSGIILPNGSTADVGSVMTLTGLNNDPVVISVATSGVYIGGTDSSSTYFPNPTIVPVPIATIANSVIYANPGATAVVVGSQTISVNGPAVTFSSKIIQLSPSNIVISDMNSGSVSTLELPDQSSAAVPPVPIATIGSQTISAAPGASTVVVQGQTLSAGGSPITLDANVVASLGTSGIVIQYPGGGVSSVALPTAAPQTGMAGGDGNEPIPIVTIAGQVISALPGASTIVFQGQTLSIGGSPVTLPANIVASVGPSGLVVQYPGGGVSSFTLPTTAPDSSGIIGTVDGSVISAVSGAGGGKVVIGSQTLTVGGTPITLGDNDVVSLGASGVVVQKPGGGITTLSVPTQTELLKSTTTSTNPIAGAIASSKSSPYIQYMPNN
jgi:hypothetical protein